MKIGTIKYIYSIVLGAFCVIWNTNAYADGLSPENFNKMYYLATQGRVDILRGAVNRGLNIDAVNPNGDTGLCIAIKHDDYTAFKTFQMAGANPKHACTFRIYKEYRQFLETNHDSALIRTNSIHANSYWNKDRSWLPWILGAAVVGGGVWALTHHSGGSKHHKSSGGGDTPTPVDPDDPIVSSGIGLAGYINNYKRLINSRVENVSTINARNGSSDEVVDNIKFLPNMLDNYSYLQSYVKVIDKGYYHNANKGNIVLGDASVGLSAYGDNSKVSNDGIINIEARNGAIGLVASNGAKAVNGENFDSSSSKGSISLIFKGGVEGDAVIGMYGDTQSRIENMGKIAGTASSAETSDNSGDVQNGGLVSIVGDDEEVIVSTANSGSMLGMALFDFYTGEDLSSNTVTAKNSGNIILQAGNNNATSAAISLIGMGSYLDDKFLNGKNNPAYAEKMLLENTGDISLSYQKTYNIASDALKLGDGGVIGIRADASTGATNKGNIFIDMQATKIASKNDVAAGMLSVHGAQLVNGTVGSAYDGTSSTTGGTIRLINEATSGGVFYGMLAAKGSGTQTGLYKWQTPFLHNYGFIDMQVSNSYAMASFAGGEIINEGVINLGVENGQSYYTNNYGLYAAGQDITEEVLLTNGGIINVYSEQSAAIYNVFSGSVTETNTGYIYLSNKAVGSKVFGGNYSTAINEGDIWYKVGNSATFSFPTGSQDKIGLNVDTTPVASVIEASGSGSSTTTQEAINAKSGVITIGAEYDKTVDYGGTYGTAAMQVSNQASATNEGKIYLRLHDIDISQFNVGMWLNSGSTAESYLQNLGDIYVDSPNSIGIRNDSSNHATATNLGNIYVNSEYDYGMAVTKTGANLFNGRYTSGETDPKTIYVNGKGSIGMYIRNGNTWNYGLIKLLHDSTTAFQLDGANSTVVVEGDIEFTYGLSDITYFWMTNGAKKTFDHDVIVDGYILGKATKDSSGGYAYLSKGSTAYVRGPVSRLFVGIGNGSQVYNQGVVEVSDGARGMAVYEGAVAVNDTRTASLYVKDDNSVGIYGEDKGSLAQTTAGSKMYVEAGEGLHVEGFAQARNEGSIAVSKGIGIYAADGSGDTYTQAYNIASLSASGSQSIGAKIIDGAKFSNSGNIIVSDGATGVYTDSEITNLSKGIIEVNDDSTGIKNVGRINAINDGKIYVSGANASGVYGLVDNNGLIRVSGDDSYGVVGTLTNYGTVEVNGSKSVGVSGTLVNRSEYIVDSGIGGIGSLNNKSEYTVNGGIGFIGSGTNNSRIVSTGTLGLKVDGSFTNAGSIKGTGVAVEVANGSFTNTGSISVSSGTAIVVDNGAYADNQGTISIGDGIGIRVKNGGSAVNSGGASITLSQGGYGVFVEDGGTFTNGGTINYNSSKNGHCTNIGITGECIDTAPASSHSETSTVLGSLINLEDGASFINKGVVDFSDQNVDFDTNGQYVIADGGSYKLASFKGNVVASSDIVMNDFKNTYIQENAFYGENKGLKISSQSYMFNARVSDKGDASDIVLERKDFKELVKERDLSQFFEESYGRHSNEKMFKALKSAPTLTAFTAEKDSESGKKFYANLPRENMAVLRGLQNQEQSRVLSDGLNGVSAGVNYYRTGKDGVDGLSDYNDDVYSAYISGGRKANRLWSIGATVEAAYDDASYDDIHSERNNKILMAFIPIMYQNERFKFLAMPSLGAGFGSYSRHTLQNKYDADTFDIYLGMYNHAEYSIDMKIAELVSEAELNLQSIHSDKAEEKGGLFVKNNNATSLEGGIGIKLRKRIEFNKRRELILALGTKYYHEFLDPYQDLTIGAKGVSSKYHLKGYDEDKNRLKTTAEATYKDGDFAITATVSHNAEKDDNVEGGLGVRYNF